MAVLETIPDPEIPVLTIMDLGIVRGIEDQSPAVQVSPTYTGCPATVAIEVRFVTRWTRRLRDVVIDACSSRPGRPTGSPSAAGSA